MDVIRIGYLVVQFKFVKVDPFKAHWTSILDNSVSMQCEL